ncbi:MAG: hypothetical protein ACI9VR_000856 [Cognaticolwellia sp.]|jgi:uncharacterized protein (TIGR03382 family)
MRPDANLPVLLLLISLPAQACGPYYDYTQLSWQGQHMLQAPTTSFKLEMQRLAVETQAPPLATPKRVRTADADRADLTQLLKDPVLVEAALQAREKQTPLPPELPQEFQLYQAGAIASAQVKLDAAQTAWRAVLDLPLEQRQYRGSWAAYMLGNTTDDPAQAAAWYQQTRSEIAQGGQDSAGLYVASLRQESWVQSRAEQPVLALSLCLQYRSSGASVFCQDLRPLAEDVLRQDDLSLATQDPLVAQAIAALLTNPGSSVWYRLDLEEQTRRWLAASENHQDLAAADRLAWAAYRSGDMEAAKAWLERSPETPMSHWIQAKLHLQAGELTLAEASLAQGGTLLPQAAQSGRPLFSTHCEHDNHDPARAIHVELGVVRVALGDYAGALQAFLEAGDWMDGAWVAERLLTTDELRAQVDLHWPKDTGQPAVERLLDGGPLPAAQIASSMRHLLARRLAREGRWDQAIEYFPEELQLAASDVGESIDKADDKWRRDDVRGTHLWNAAYEMKQQGWALLATEMEPDFRVLEGLYQGADTLNMRLDPIPPAPLFATQPAELAKLATTRPPNEQRYHFVWTAAELAEQAVGLMDDGNPDLPQALCTSGLWQKTRDPVYSARAFHDLYSRVPESTLNGAVFLDFSSMGLCQPTPPATKGCQSVPGGGFWAIAGLVMLLRRRRSELA